MKSRNIIPVFVPHCGCPHDCAFCNQKKITQQNEPLKDIELRKFIQEYLHYFKNKKETQIAFYGGSFTGIPKDEMIKYLEIGNEFIETGEVDSLRLSTRPDYINKDILKILKQYKVKTIELGVQSMDNAVLQGNKRGHNSQAVVESVKMIQGYSFELGLQLMIGLYGDTLKSAFFSAEQVAKLEPDFVRIYPTLILEDTYLEELFSKGLYKPLELEEAVDILERIIPIFYLKNIPIIRVGLQPTDEIAENGSVVAGPFHPSIRMLAEERIYYNFLKSEFEKFRKIEKIDIIAPNSSLNYFIGLNKKNKEKIMEAYNPKSIRFKGKDQKDFQLIIDEKMIRFKKEEIYKLSLNKVEEI